MAQIVRAQSREIEQLKQQLDFLNSASASAISSSSDLAEYLDPGSASASGKIEDSSNSGQHWSKEESDFFFAVFFKFEAESTTAEGKYQWKKLYRKLKTLKYSWSRTSEQGRNHFNYFKNRAGELEKRRIDPDIISLISSL